MRVKIRSTSALTADATGIAASQTFTINVPLTLTGGAASLSPPRRLSFDATASIAAVIFTIVGRDRNGAPITETVTGVTTTPVSTQYIYASVTSITPSATDGVNQVFVGWTAEVISAPLMLDHYRNPFNVGLGVVVTGTVSYSIQHTFEDLQVTGTVDGAGTWFDHEFLAAQSANGDGNYAFAVEAIRLVQLSGTGSVTMKVMQSGLRGA